MYVFPCAGTLTSFTFFNKSTMCVLLKVMPFAANTLVTSYVARCAFGSKAVSVAVLSIRIGKRKT